ncbi:MAG: PDZ domain-containing protein, partial [Bacteroidota bacterium]
LFLGRSGFFSLDAMLAEFSIRLQKHMDNPGRTNHSVAASSFDTWLDGYVQGVPGRKVSIYDEGCLIAWILDFMIRSSKQNKKSLDDVMHVLYHDFALKGLGYSGDDFKAVCESIAERNFDVFFSETVHTPKTLLTPLSEAISLAGLEIEISNSVLLLERIFGLRISGNKVRSTYPGSPAWKAGLVMDDEIVSINGNPVTGSVHQVADFEYEVGDSMVFKVISFGKVRDLVLHPDQQTWFDSYRIKSAEMITQQQLLFRESWLGRI